MSLSSKRHNLLLCLNGRNYSGVAAKQNLLEQVNSDFFVIPLRITAAGPL